MRTDYNHMFEGGVAYAPGQRVDAAQVIAAVGIDGNSTRFRSTSGSASTVSTPTLDR